MCKHESNSCLLACVSFICSLTLSISYIYVQYSIQKYHFFRKIFGRMYIFTDTCFVHPRTRQYRSGQRAENSWCHQSVLSNVLSFAKLLVVSEQTSSLFSLVFSRVVNKEKEFPTEGSVEVALESWPELDLNPCPLNSVQML